MSSIPLIEGRRSFGDDPTAYAAARPEYPDALYRYLVDRCGLRPATATFEVGAGTGLATRRLLEHGAAPLLAIEPDPRLAAYIRRHISSTALHIEVTPFEEAALAPASFDLGVAATSFHWVEQASGLAKVHAALRLGGWWAMWWNQFGADEQDDAFQAATSHLFDGIPDSPSRGHKSGTPFSLDRDARLGELAAAGFERPNVEIWHWTRRYETARLVALYRTFSPVHALEPQRRDRFLRDLARIADEQFGGSVERPLTTALYTAERG